MKKPYRFDFQKLKLIYSQYNTIESAISSKERRDRTLIGSITRKESEIKNQRQEQRELQKSVNKLRLELPDLEGQVNVRVHRSNTLKSGIEKTKEEIRDLSLLKEDLERNIASKNSELRDLEKGIRNERQSLSTLAYQSGELKETRQGLETLVRDLNDSTSEIESRRESLLKEVNELNLTLENKRELERHLSDFEEKIKSSSVLSTIASILEKPETLTQDKEVLLKPLSQILKGAKVYVVNSPKRFKSPRSLGESLDKAIELTEKELI